MTPEHWIAITSPICVLLGYVACILIKRNKSNRLEERAIELMSEHFLAMKELTDKFADLSCQQFNQLHNAKIFDALNSPPMPISNSMQPKDGENDFADLLGAGQ
jgi:hypothetical protein